MQFVLNFSKTLIIAVLSCFILITWYGKDVAVIDSITFIPSSLVKTPVKTRMKKAESAGSVWNSISNEFQLDHRDQSARVKAEIHKLLAEKGKFNQILKAAGPYIYFIHKQTQSRGLPAEMALIPIIESEFNPNDHSTKGATGLWQLMRGTAHELGIKVISGYDGRRNVPASTKAALAYLNDLGKYFKGNWYLALAAYNAGQVKVDKAVHRAGSHSFWNLTLPQETKYYVPRLLAVAAIIQNPEKYGVKLPHINDKPYFTELKFKKAIKLETIAKATGISLEALRVLNPDYKNGVVASKKGTYALLVPVNQTALVKSQFADSIVS